MLSHLESEERYYGDQRLFICPQTKMALEGMRTWSEICLQRAGGEARAISACANRSCRQPALSADGKSAVYVKVAH
jgi:hypothetical protein